MSKKRENTIVRNTALLMFRMGIVMIINLAVVRFLRTSMGVVDYGVFYAVTGLTQLMTCLNTVLASASQRFLSTSLGKNDERQLCDSFQVSVRISYVVAAVVVFLLETIGLWFLFTQMNYPPERQFSVVIIFQMAVGTFLLTLIQVPYLTSVMAHEKMNVFAWVTILENIGRLVVAALLPFLPGDKMIVYGVGLFATTFISTLIYIVYCRLYFIESHYSRIEDRSLYLKMIRFIGWTLYGSLAGVLLLQGNMLQVNTLFGPVANAAFVVALQIFNAVTVFGNTVIVAVKPQLVMNCSAGKYDVVNRLLKRTYLALAAGVIVVIIPVLIYMPQILTLWLGIVDDMTISFCRLMLIVCVIILFGAPITTIIQAVGRVREYHLPVESVMILSLPLGYLLVKTGYGPNTLCWAIIVCAVVAHIIRIERIWRYYYRTIVE